MNKFELKKFKKPEGPQKVELTLSDAIHDTIIDTLKKEWLLPILNAERKELPDGMTYYCFYLPDEDAEILKQAFIQAYTKAEGYNTSN